MILVLALLVPGPILAAGLTCAPSADSGEKIRLEEPKEAPISVKGAAYDVRDMQAWLGLLVGQYTYEGHVDLCGKGNANDQRPVTGKADCIAAGSPPTSVHCRVNVNWPASSREIGSPVLGGVSNLAPAQLLFSIEGRPRNAWGLVLMQLDNRSRAEWASGELVGDTFISTEPCVDISGSFQKITQITARADSNKISMLVDIEIGRQRALRQSFLLHRESNLPNSGQRTGSSP
jgi:hypothetical protein